MGNREYKSDVFCMLLEDKKNALALYNAINGSNHTNPEMVEICTLEGGISLTIRNDSAFVRDLQRDLSLSWYVQYIISIRVITKSCLKAAHFLKNICNL